MPERMSEVHVLADASSEFWARAAATRNTRLLNVVCCATGTMSTLNGDDDVIPHWVSGEECQPGMMVHCHP